MKCKCGSQEIDIQAVFSVEPMTAVIICRGCGNRVTAFTSGRGYKQAEACTKAIEEAERMFVEDGGVIE